MALPTLIFACGSDPADPASDAGPSPYTLALVGSADLKLHPGGERTLHVLVAEDEVGPLASARVHFDFRQDAAGSRIDASDVVADEDGIARVRLTAGFQPTTAPFQLVATTPDLGAAPVAFTISVIPERRLLQVVPTTATRVSSDGASGATRVGVFSSVPLRVREMDADTGEPVAHEWITFTLPEVATSRWSTTSSKVAIVETGVGGEARAFLITAQAAEGPWQVIARAAGGSAVAFQVTVQDAGGASCSANAQCAPGQVCAGEPPACQDDPDPPPDPQCDPALPGCPAGQCCDAMARVCIEACPISCGTGTHCEAGPGCGAGACMPDETVPDLTGMWLTKHDFNLRESVPLGVGEILKAFRLMDQTLLGKLAIPGLPAWLQEIVNAFVSRLLQQYLPEWTQQIIHVSDDLFTVLSHLRSEGRMQLNRDGDLAHLKGKEVWTSLVFYWLPLCNGDISGNPDEPPECARIDVVTSDAESADETAQCKGQVLPSIRVQAAPFSAAVVNRDGVFALEVHRRQVALKMGKVILILFDQLLTLVTGGEYHCIDEATLCPLGGACLVDCEGLGRDVESATSGIVDSGTVEQLCGHGVRAWGELMVEALARAWPVTAETLDFSGSALISGQVDDSVCHSGTPPGTCAALLGAGEWTGDLFFDLLHRQHGAWEAWRPE